MFHLNRTSVIWASLIARYKTAAKAATFDTIVGAQTLPLHQSYSANISASAASAPRRVVWGRPRYPLSLTPPLAPASGTPAEEESIKGLRTALMRIGLKWKKKKRSNMSLKLCSQLKAKDTTSLQRYYISWSNMSRKFRSQLLTS